MGLGFGPGPVAVLVVLGAGLGVEARAGVRQAGLGVVGLGTTQALVSRRDSPWMGAGFLG